jgi:tetratricopeptide (TPR) repeat protein
MMGDAGRSQAAAPQAMAAAPQAAAPQMPSMPPGGGNPMEMPGRPAVDPNVRQHLQEAEAAARMKPGDYDALVHLGNSAYDAREFAQAADAYERALKIRPNDANVMTDLGTAYRNEGQVDKALDMFRRARAADPKHWQSLYNEVIVLAADKGDAAGARAAFEKLKAEQPNLPALAGLEQQISGAAAAK